MTNITNGITFRVLEDNQPAEIIKIAHDGNIYWRGRLIESDQDFKSAMLDLHDAMMKMREFVNE